MKIPYIHIRSLSIAMLSICTLINSGCSKDDGPETKEIIKSDAKQITSFVFDAGNNPFDVNITGIIDEQNKTITVNLPSDTPIDALTPVVSVSKKATVNLSGEQDFTNTLTYIVTAEDGSTTNYAVSVISNSSGKQITSFVFLLAENPINVNVVGTINEDDKTITAEMPTDTDITGLLPEIEFSALASLDVNTVRDFTDPLEYTLTAEDGSTSTYTVIVSVKLSQRQILQAILDANPGNFINWDLENTENLGDLNGIETNSEGAIIELSIGGSGLSNLPPEIGLLSNLKALDLVANKIATLPMEIGQLVNLNILSLSVNELTSLPAEIGQLSNLNLLNLSGNELTSLPAEIGQLSNLNILRLSSNELTSIPPEIGNLTKLLTINAGANQLTVLPTEIGQLSNLKRLYLTQNQLTSLPQEIGQLVNLEILSSESNDLTTLPPQIGQLVNLEELWLQGNKLSTIPPEIGQLVNLEELWLNSNKLSTIPSEIGQLVNLEELKLYSNKLSTIPPEIGQLVNLEELMLYSNKLSTIPPEIGFLSRLGNIQMADNNIEFIPESVANLKLFNDPGMTFSYDDTSAEIRTVSQMDALISIYSANPGNTLDWGVDNYPQVEFKANGEPRTITMNNKNLTRIPPNITAMTSLEGLNVNSNNLTSLPTELADINTLIVITAANNGLNTVPAAFGQLNNLALLSITNNPITSLPQEVCDLQTSNSGILTILADPGEGCN